LQLENVTGSVRIALADRAVVFNLQASSTGPVFTYEIIQDSTPAAIQAGQTISLPDATVGGDKTSLTVRVRNTGSADGRIAQIGVLGSGFQLTELPFLPLVLTPGSGFAFTVNFTPTQPGRAAGRLQIGGDTFELTGNGLGASAVYSYV